MKNIHVLPTDKKSNLVKRRITGEIKISSLNNPQLWDNVNIYITNDEEIKFNDYITDGYKVWKWKDDSSLLGRKKIILTTDTDLIKDGVQAIDDEFLELFVKNPSCEYVETVNVPYFDESGYSYLLIVPKEEPKQECKGSFKDCFNPLNECVCDSTKQETLEEATKKYSSNGSWQCPISFQAGAKCQQQQNKNLYSEGEVEYLLYSFKNYLGFGEEVNEKKWFEQFSKLKNG